MSRLGARARVIQYIRFEDTRRPEGNMKRILIPIAMVALVISAAAQPAKKPAARAAAAVERDTIVTKTGLTIIMRHRGKGLQVKPGQLAIVHYTGRLDNDSVFDSSLERAPFAFRVGVGQVIKGWDEGFLSLRVGDKATLIIPPDLAYGDRERPRIPANSRLTFDVELLALHERSIGDTIRGTLDRDGVPAAQKLFAALRKSKYSGFYLSEDELNGMGYKYLAEGKSAEAIAIFKMNVRAFPKSANVYDSLGEAYMKSGDAAAAIANYKRSLELDASNTNAVEMLKQLQTR